MSNFLCRDRPSPPPLHPAGASPLTWCASCFSDAAGRAPVLRGGREAFLRGVLHEHAREVLRLRQGHHRSGAPCLVIDFYTHPTFQSNEIIFFAPFFSKTTKKQTELLIRSVCIVGPLYCVHSNLRILSHSKRTVCEPCRC